MRAKQIEPDKKFTNNGNFNAFIEEIKNGNVLLMIGRAYEANSGVFQGDFYDYILRELNSIAGTENLDFSDLHHDNRFLFDKDDHNHIRNLHEEIINIIEKNEYSACDDVQDGLLNIIKTGLFRFVFTTTFDPLVEIAMKETFGTVRVMNIYDKGNRDIQSIEDFTIPTIYYIFGKAALPEKNEVIKKFVATDNDALEVLRKWQIDMGNSLLLRYTSEKYLLTLGCTQDDWLFRFIWYTMKGETSKLSKGVVSGHSRDESLAHYLKMNHILIDNNPDDLINKIIHNISLDNGAKWKLPPLQYDVFISYSRADKEYAEELYKSLTSKGLNVWYDKMNLGGRQGGPYMTLLKEAIETSRIFIALLSNSISEQSKDVHIYRREWEWAKDYKYGLTADCRCYAIFADNYDINERKYSSADSLGWLAEIDNFTFSATEPNFESCADILRSKINKIKSHDGK